MEVGYFIFITVLNLVLALVFGKIGEKRSIGYGWAFVATFFLGLIGMIIVLCSKKNNDTEFIDVENKNLE